LTEREKFGLREEAHVKNHTFVVWRKEIIAAREEVQHKKKVTTKKLVD
jgi:hypothetical protein